MHLNISKYLYYLLMIIKIFHFALAQKMRKCCHFLLNFLINYFIIIFFNLDVIGDSHKWMETQSSIYMKTFIADKNFSILAN